MYRRIVVASDFSAPAAAGAKLAAALAAPDATLVALHVVPSVAPQAFAAPAVGLDPVPGMGWGQLVREGNDPEEMRQLQGRLEAWIDESGVRGMSGAVVRGDIAGTLLHEAEERAADLLVLGARGHSRLEDVLLGNNARNVMRHAKADVLLAEADGRHQTPPRRIAVGTSFDELSVLAARRALTLARETRAQLFLLHAIGPGIQTGATYGLTPPRTPLQEESGWLEREVDRKLADFNAEHLEGLATPLWGRGHFSQELIRLAHEARADLLVAGHPPESWVERLLLGSVAEAVARHPPCPMLFVHG